MKKRINYEKLRIIQDTREQSPFEWNSAQYANFEIGVDKLDYGDYSIAGYDRPGDDCSVIIERKKNCRELCSNLVAEWDRFKNELVGLSKYKHPFIIVCENYSYTWLYEQGLTRVHPHLIVKRLAEIQLDYKIPVLFFDSKGTAERFVFQTFVEVTRRSE